MNGNDFDERLTDLNKAKALINTNKEDFCRATLERANIYFTSDGIKMHEKSLTILREKIESDTFDKEAVSTALQIINILIDFVLKVRENMIVSYTKLVRKDIKRNRLIENLLKTSQRILQLLIILGATALPFMLNSDIPKTYSSVVSVTIAIAAALMTFYKFNKYISYFSRATEKIQTEYNLYHSSRKHYSSLLKGEALDLFMDKIDELREEQNKLAFELHKTEEEQEQNIQTFTKGISK